MKRSLIFLLICPKCKSELKLLSSTFDNRGEIETGILSCVNCKQIYPIRDGIPRMLINITHQKKTLESFYYEWSHYNGQLGDEKKIFLEETQIAEKEWAGKLVLDAGCGMGRFTKVALELGAEVVAIDLSESIIRTKELSKMYDRLHVLQTDLLSLPFQEKIFDIVYSQGVIHHTPQPEKAFFNLAQLLRPGGILTVWVYGKAGRYKNFKTNPLRKDHLHLKKISFLVWLVVLIRGLISNILRKVTTKLPYPLLYYFCYPLGWLGRLPLIKYLTFSVHPHWKVRLQENFDWLSPEYQSHHIKEEVSSWFEQAGFSDLEILAHGFVPKVGIKGIKR